jgi:hypothetical protein
VRSGETVWVDLDGRRHALLPLAVVPDIVLLREEELEEADAAPP